MAPLIKISSSLLPYPTFIHLNHPTPPSSSQSFPSPYSLPFSPNHPYSHAPKFCLVILSASNFQEDLYMFFLGFTLLFSFFRIMKYRLNVPCLWLESNYEWVHTMLCFGVWVISIRIVFSITVHLHSKLKMSLFRLPSRTLMCICATHPLSILLLRGT